MTNLFLVIFLGGAIGWIATALTPRFGRAMALGNIIAGAIAGFAGALFANGGTLYTGLSGQTFAISALAAATTVTLAGLLRRRFER